MSATFYFYIIAGLLTVVPLILFNINRVFVRKKPEPLKINWVRGVVILLLCAFIVVFLVAAYNATLHQRYEIALERVATEHAETMLGLQDVTEFNEFVLENGTENVAASLETFEIGTANGETVKFLLGKQCVPKYWTQWTGMTLKEDLSGDADYPLVYMWNETEEITVYDEENPVYLMYLLDVDGVKRYVAVRLVKTEEGWLYDWIGTPNDQMQKDIKMPTEKNGKWYSVSK